MTSEQRNVLVTGAQGFVGRKLCNALSRSGIFVRAVVRQSSGVLERQPNLSVFEVGDLSHFAGWKELLHGVDAVVHLIARTHVTDEFGAAAMSEYRRTNVDLTRRLAKACVRERVQHFLYMSSIKAVGNGSLEDYSETTPCCPEDSYGITKWEAERQLIETCRDTECRYTILRPPLVYGPGVGGNFLRLMQLVLRGIPLPAVTNLRSMVHIENLVDATRLCLQCDSSHNQVLHVADPIPVSTSTLVRSMAEGLQTSAVLVPAPKALLHGLGRLAGKHEEIKRLTGSLTVSSSKIQDLLKWQQQIETKAGVMLVSRAYRRQPWLVADEKLPGEYEASTRKEAA